MTYEITPYTPQDWPALCAIHDEARRRELALAGLSPAFLTLAQTYEEEELFAGEVWVARQGGAALGFIAFAGQEITWLYVAMPAWRRGVGRALVQQAIARTAGPLSLEVLAGNLPAIALYESMGFRRVRTVSGHLEGNMAFPATGHVYTLER